MHLETLNIEDALVVRPMTKSLDASVAQVLREQLISVIDGASGRVLIDLDVVEFIDSTGLGAIVAAFKMAQNANLVGICRPRRTVASLLRLTRLDKVFAVHDTVEQAISDPRP